jgi:hypothetical protein
MTRRGKEERSGRSVKMVVRALGSYEVKSERLKSYGWESIPIHAYLISLSQYQLRRIGYISRTAYRVPRTACCISYTHTPYTQARVRLMLSFDRSVGARSASHIRGSPKKQKLGPLNPHPHYTAVCGSKGSETLSVLSYWEWEWE